MFIFGFHIAISLMLIALALGGVLLLFSKVHSSVLAKVIACVVIIIALLNLSCASYYAVKYWREGYFAKPMPMVAMMQKMFGEQKEQSKTLWQKLQEQFLEKKK